MVGGLLLRLNLAIFFGVSLLGSRGFVLLGNALWNLFGTLRTFGSILSSWDLQFLN